MTGNQLIKFCEALCAAIAKGALSFEFEGEQRTTTQGQISANRWLEAELDQGDDDGGEVAS